MREEGLNLHASRTEHPPLNPSRIRRLDADSACEGRARVGFLARAEGQGRDAFRNSWRRPYGANFDTAPSHPEDISRRILLGSPIPPRAQKLIPRHAAKTMAIQQ